MSALGNSSVEGDPLFVWDRCRQARTTARLCRWLPAGGLQCPEVMPTPPSIIQLGGVVRLEKRRACSKIGRLLGLQLLHFIPYVKFAIVFYEVLFHFRFPKQTPMRQFGLTAVGGATWSAGGLLRGIDTDDGPLGRDAERLDPDQRCRLTAAKKWLMARDGLPLSKWPRSRFSFSASLGSSSCYFPFWQHHEGRGASRLAPLLLALPAHRRARRVLRLEPRLRRPAAVRRVHPLRHDAFQPHAADMLEHGRAVARQMFNELDRGPPWSFRSAS